MGSVKATLLAGATACIALGAAGAADLPPIIHKAPPIPVEEFGGWYLRGDIGMTNQRLKNFHHPLMDGAPQFTFLDGGGFDSGWLLGLGVGYQFNSWLRADITGEYRGKTSFHGLDRYWEPVPGEWRTNDYGGAKSEWVGLANVYADLGTWWCLTPFIGAGVGFAYNTFDHYRDLNNVTGEVGFADAGSKWNFAWALHAGLAYKVTPGFTVELAYRYLNLGDAQTGIVYASGGTCSACAPTTFNDLTSHDIKLGVRWSLEPMPAYPPPPLMRKG